MREVQSSKIKKKQYVKLKMQSLINPFCWVGLVVIFIDSLFDVIVTTYIAILPQLRFAIAELIYFLLQHQQEILYNLTRHSLSASEALQTHCLFSFKRKN